MSLERNLVDDGDESMWSGAARLDRVWWVAAWCKEGLCPKDGSSLFFFCFPLCRPSADREDQNMKCIVLSEYSVGLLDWSW